MHYVLNLWVMVFALLLIALLIFLKLYNS